ncbi:glycosyltransferase family protein [Methylotetracoccus oryzae]|uniref:glycosyltransferase family 4 protein n=1 Tax=Methylotetracoccus oryzae TaxID=1919059 RepID=UPI00111A3D4B|nr:glycosyltransferase family 4 protein [Methylotetracoccus oryzae]
MGKRTLVTGERNGLSIVIRHPEGNVASNPTLASLVETLTGAGYSVHISSWFPPSPVGNAPTVTYAQTNRLLSYIKSIIFDRVCSRFLAKILLRVELLLKGGSFDLCIGIDRNGLIEAALISEILGIPYCFISFEITVERETSKKYKDIERVCARGVSFWVVQDEQRGELLQAENKLDPQRVFYLPLSSPAVSGVGDRRIRDELGIPAEKKVALIFGSLSEWTLAAQVINGVRAWPREWVLLIHERYGNTHASLAAQGIDIDDLLSDRIYLSNVEMNNVNDMGPLLNGASATLAFYRPTYKSPHTGINLKVLGLAAGKISTSLRYGVPVIMNEIGTYSELARINQFGVVVERPACLPNALSNLDDKDRLSLQAKEFFLERLDYNLYKSALLEKIAGAIEHEDTASLA